MSPAEIHQIVFRWSERPLLGGPGVGPVATSLDGRQLPEWSNRLRHGDFVHPTWRTDTDRLPVMGALRLGATDAVIVRAVFTEDDHGRPSKLVHVLLGPLEDLLDLHALSLCDWAGWARPERPLPAELDPVDLTAAREAATSARHELRAVSLGHPLLPGVAADVFNAPTQHYRLIVPPGTASTDPGEDVIPELAFALIDVFGRVAPEPVWTFLVRAELKSRLADARLLILDQTPPPSAHHSLRRVSLHPGAAATRTGPVSPSMAGALIGAMATNQIDYPPPPLRSAHDSATWIAGELRRLSGVVPLLCRAARGDLTAKDQSDLEEPGPWLAEGFTTCSPAEAAEILELWQPVRAFPEARRVLTQVGIRRALDAAQSDAPEKTTLLWAVRAMPPPVGAVAEGLAAMYHERHKPGAEEVSRVLISAVTLGINAETDPTVAWLLGALEPYVLLHWAVDQVRPGRPERQPGLAAACLHQIKEERIDPPQRDACRKIVKDDHGMVGTVDAITSSTDKKIQLYGKVLLAAYGLPRSADDIRAIVEHLRDTGAATAEIAWSALVGLSLDATLRFAVAAGAVRIGAKEVAVRLLPDFSLPDLITGAARHGAEGAVVRTVIPLVQRRFTDASAKEAELGRVCLRKHGYLAGAIALAYPDRDEQVATIKQLLTKAYRATELPADDVTELCASSAATEDAFLVAVAMLASPQGKRVVHRQIVRRTLEARGFSANLIEAACGDAMAESGPTRGTAQFRETTQSREIGQTRGTGQSGQTSKTGQTRKTGLSGLGQSGDIGQTRNFRQTAELGPTRETAQARESGKARDAGEVWSRPLSRPTPPGLELVASGGHTVKEPRGDRVPGEVPTETYDGGWREAASVAKHRAAESRPRFGPKPEHTLVIGLAMILIGGIASVLLILSGSGQDKPGPESSETVRTPPIVITTFGPFEPPPPGGKEDQEPQRKEER